MNPTKHMKITGICLILVTMLSCIVTVQASADVILPHIIGSNMVLQRDMPLPVWGWADPGETVTVTLGTNEVSARANEKGSWMVNLPAMKAGGPFQMTVRGKNTIFLTVGDFPFYYVQLATRDGKALTWFEIAGGDKKFVKAQTKIAGGSVVVWSDSVAKPIAVRFGWHEEAEPNLINKEKLPASPFRTDTW